MAGPADRSPPEGDTFTARSVLLDPRMQDRRAQVEQEHAHRRRKRWLLALVPVLLVVMGVGLAFSPLLAVRDLQVAGTEETTEAEVLSAAGVRTGRPMLTLDRGGIAGRVEELPWVASVRVDRDWPGTVRLEISEREPVAVAVADGSNFVAWVDEDGRVLRVGGEVPEGFVAISGLETVPEEGHYLPDEALGALSVAALAPDVVPGSLDEVSLDLEAVVAEGRPGAGATVSFGQVEELEERLVALESVLTSWDVTCLASVNLAVPDRPVVTRRADCSGNG